jgi:hypothetical protein
MINTPMRNVICSWNSHCITSHLCDFGKGMVMPNIVIHFLRKAFEFCQWQYIVCLSGIDAILLTECLDIGTISLSFQKQWLPFQFLLVSLLLGRVRFSFTSRLTISSNRVWRSLKSISKPLNFWIIGKLFNCKYETQRNSEQTSFWRKKQCYYCLSCHEQSSTSRPIACQIMIINKIAKNCHAAFKTSVKHEEIFWRDSKLKVTELPMNVIDLEMGNVVRSDQMASTCPCWCKHHKLLLFRQTQSPDQLTVSQPRQWIDPAFVPQRNPWQCPPHLSTIRTQQQWEECWTAVQSTPAAEDTSHPADRQVPYSAQRRRRKVFAMNSSQ